MKIINSLTGISLILIAAGCADRRDQYTYGDEVISSPGSTVVYRHRGYRGPSPAELQRQADENLATSVRNQFYRYGDLNNVAPGVSVTAQSGTVTLSGSVPTQRDKEMIDAMARNTTGVAAVNDLLQVSEPFSPTGRAIEPPRTYPNTSATADVRVDGRSDNDRQIGRNISDRLRRDPSWDASFANVDIYVDNGEVIVMGTVEDETQKQRIVAAVERAAGVDVRNELHARPIVR